MAIANPHEVIAAAAALQARLAWLAPVADVGLAAALHAGHRRPVTAGNMAAGLANDFDRAVAALEAWDDWATDRVRPPKHIIGLAAGVPAWLCAAQEAGRMSTELRDGLRVPTAAETLRLVAYRWTERGSAAYPIEVAALADLLGQQSAISALASLNDVYPPRGNQSRLTAFAMACFEEADDAAIYAADPPPGLRAPYDDPFHVARVCRTLGATMARMELDGSLPGDRQRLSQNKTGTSGKAEGIDGL